MFKVMVFFILLCCLCFAKDRVIENVTFTGVNDCYSEGTNEIIISGDNTTFFSPINRKSTLIVLGSGQTVNIDLNEGETPNISNFCILFAGDSTTINLNVNTTLDKIFIRGLGLTTEYNITVNGVLLGGTIHLYGGDQKIKVYGDPSVTNCAYINWLNFGMGNDFACGLPIPAS